MEDKIIMSSYKKEIVEREIKSFYKTIFFSPIIVGILSILGLYRFGVNLPIIIGTVSFVIIFGFF